MNFSRNRASLNCSGEKSLLFSACRSRSPSGSAMSAWSSGFVKASRMFRASSKARGKFLASRSSFILPS